METSLQDDTVTRVLSLRILPEEDMPLHRRWRASRCNSYTSWCTKSYEPRTDTRATPWYGSKFSLGYQAIVPPFGGAGLKMRLREELKEAGFDEDWKTLKLSMTDEQGESL